MLLKSLLWFVHNFFGKLFYTRLFLYAYYFLMFNLQLKWKEHKKQRVVLLSMKNRISKPCRSVRLSQTFLSVIVSRKLCSTEFFNVAHFWYRKLSFNTSKTVLLVSTTVNSELSFAKKNFLGQQDFVVLSRGFCHLLVSILV